MKHRNLRRETLRKTYALQRYPVSILLDGLHDAVNIGGMMRLTNAFTAEGIYYRGNLSKVRIGKTAVGTQNFEKLEKVEEHQLANWLSQFDEIIALDNNVGFKTERIEEISFLPHKKYLFILGNETDGVSKEMLEAAHRIVTISQRGAVGSLNVALAGAIALYEYNKQQIGGKFEMATG